MTKADRITEALDWIYSVINSRQPLYQYELVDHLNGKFPDLVYQNDAGNDAVDKALLRRFNSETADTVVWERREKLWRLRERYDDPGRSQE